MAMTYPPRRSWNGSGTSLSPPVRSCSRHSANCQRYSGFAEAARGARQQRARTDSSTVRRSFMAVTSWPAARARLAPRAKTFRAPIWLGFSSRHGAQGDSARCPGQPGGTAQASARRSGVAPGRRGPGIVRRRAAVEPNPPRVAGSRPWVGAGMRLLRNPAGFFAAARRRLGDTYVVDAFGYRLFCVFSPAGVRALYGVPEDSASFGLATRHLLSLKLPPELFEGRRTTARTLFGGEDVERYLANLEDAVGLEIAERGESGTFEVFETMRRLGHRLGLASWIGPEAAAPPWVDRLAPQLDLLDSADAFVRPAQAFLVAATRYARERRAMHTIERAVAAIRAEQLRDPRSSRGLDHVYAAYEDLPDDARHVRAARDVIMLHLGSQSNLYAALAWTLVDIVRSPALLEPIRAGDDPLLEQCVSESIRLAQRSITLRLVLRPLDVALEDRTYR